MKIPPPDFASPEWEALPKPERTRVLGLLAVLGDAPGRGIVEWLRRTAAENGFSYGSLRRSYYDLLNNSWDWKVLIDKRCTAAPAAPDELAQQPRFLAHVAELVERHQRKNAPAFRALARQWAARRHAIPGYEDWPGWPALPSGWHPRTLARSLANYQNAARLRSLRVGTSSKTNHFLPTVLTTRVGLWPLAVIQIDDVWHDSIVTYGKKREPVRPLELGALDLYTAHRFHWGCRPRRKKDAGGWEVLGGKDARLFLAGMFQRAGYSPQGTMIMSEHATARVPEDVARILYDASGGLIRVDYQPIEGRQAALNGFWSGSAGGNFRAKAALESIHNLIHNDLASLPMQTGSPSSGLTGPVTTERQLAYIERVLRDVAKRAPHRLEMLKLPTWDFHNDFIPWLVDYYHFGLASRTDHQLEGWSALGRMVQEWTLAPGSGVWLGSEEFLALPDATQLGLRQAAGADPVRWSRQRAMSPLECWERRGRTLELPPLVIADMLGEGLAREVTARRGFLEFRDQEIAPDPLVYLARFDDGPRAGREIPHGEKLMIYVLPWDDGRAICTDAKGRYQGRVPLYKRVLPVDPAAFHAAAPWDARPEVRSDALRDAAGQKHSRIADILEPGRIHHAGLVEDARDLRAYNRRVLSGAPVTPDEIARSRSAAGRQGAGTAAARRLQQRGRQIDWDAPAPDAAPTGWDALPDGEDLPEAF